MRVDDRDGGVHGRAFGRDQHLVRAAIGEGPEVDAGALQVGGGLAHRPVPDDVAAECDGVPRLDLLGPGRDLLGMLLHELLDPALIRLDHPAHLRADLVVAGLADLGVPHDALAQVVAERAGAEDFGHGAGGAAVVLEQLLEPVFRLGVADGVGRVFERGGEDVRDAELVAIDRGIFVGTGGDVRQGRHQSQQQDGKNSESWSPHGAKS